jgi:hypothetical protein
MHSFPLLQMYSIVSDPLHGAENLVYDCFVLHPDSSMLRDPRLIFFSNAGSEQVPESPASRNIVAH